MNYHALTNNLIHKPKTIKIITNFCGNCKQYFKKMLKKNYTFNDFIITNDHKADYYVIINEPYNKNIYFDIKKTIYLWMEPPGESKEKFKKFIQKNKGIYFHDINGIEWQISKNYNQLMNEKIIKSKTISTIMSDNYSTPCHKKRVHFACYLDKLKNIDIFGRLRKPNEPGNIIMRSLKNHRGSVGSIGCKDRGLFPYKYTVQCENSREKNYYTEKISDSILSECLTFYYGCPNISDFIDNKAYIIIDIDKPVEAIKIIENAIITKQWEKRIDIIRKEKRKILNKLQLFPVITNIIKEKFE